MHQLSQFTPTTNDVLLHSLILFRNRPTLENFAGIIIGIDLFRI